MRCSFCQSDNPPESRFCNACGGQLNLVPCPQCGAVNESHAPACFQCQAGLTSSQTDPDLTPASIRAPLDTVRGSADHRFETLEQIASARYDAPVQAQRAYRWPFLRFYAIALVMVGAGVAALYVYGSYERWFLPAPSDAAANDASSRTQPIRTRNAGALSEPGKDAQATTDLVDGGPQRVKPIGGAPSRITTESAAAPCAQSVAALGLCSFAGNTSKRTEGRAQ
jgi:ribosomal protein L40E